MMVSHGHPFMLEGIVFVIGFKMLWHGNVIFRFVGRKWVP